MAELSALALMAQLHAGAVAAVIGLPQYGKSRLVQEADRQGAFPRRATFDPYALRDRLEASKGRLVSPWSGRLATVRDHPTYRIPNLRRAPELLDREPLALVVSGVDLSPDALGDDFRTLAKMVWATGGVDVIAEEAGLYSRSAYDLVFQLASGGGHVGMRLVLICQSLGRLHKDVRRHLTHVMAFAQTEPDDLRALAERCGKKFAERVALHQRGTPPLVWCQGQRTA